jgi:hypothetical protein
MVSEERANAGSFGRLRTGPSTPLFAKYANCFAQDDTFYSSEEGER